MAVSWDGHESLILPRSAIFADHDFNAGNVERRMLRIYVRLESAGYLIADPDRSFRSSF